ncbi:MAG TPA: hypothetical protein DHW67_03300 [Agrobacterium sp.]|nr:hypothetical protein [Agrobacterium sp.]
MSQVRILPLQPIPPFNGQTTSGKPDGRGFPYLRTLPSGTDSLLREGYSFPFCAPAVTPILQAPAAFFFLVHFHVDLL